MGTCPHLQPHILGPIKHSEQVDWQLTPPKYMHNSCMKLGWQEHFHTNHQLWSVVCVCQAQCCPLGWHWLPGITGCCWPASQDLLVNDSLPCSASHKTNVQASTWPPKGVHGSSTRNITSCWQLGLDHQTLGSTGLAHDWVSRHLGPARNSGSLYTNKIWAFHKALHINRKGNQVISMMLQGSIHSSSKLGTSRYFVFMHYFSGQA